MKINIRHGSETILVDELQIESAIRDAEKDNLRIRTFSGDTWNLDYRLPSVQAAWEYLAAKSANAVAKDHYKRQLEGV